MQAQVIKAETNQIKNSIFPPGRLSAPWLITKPWCDTSGCKHFSENTLFATINIKAGVCTAAPPHCSRAGPGTPIVLRWAASKEPSQGDSCGTEDFHPCNPRHQSSWAHWAQAQAQLGCGTPDWSWWEHLAGTPAAAQPALQVTGPLGGSGAGNIICNSHWNIVLVCYSHTNSNSTSIIIHQQILTSLTL